MGKFNGFDEDEEYQMATYDELDDDVLAELDEDEPDPRFIQDNDDDVDDDDIFWEEDDDFDEDDWDSDDPYDDPDYDPNDDLVAHEADQWMLTSDKWVGEAVMYLDKMQANGFNMTAERLSDARRDTDFQHEYANKGINDGWRAAQEGWNDGWSGWIEEHLSGGK